MSERVRVLFVSHTIDLRAGGAERVLRSLLTTLPKESFELQLALPGNEPATDLPPGVGFHRLPPLHLTHPLSVLNAVRCFASLVRLHGSTFRLLRRLRPQALYVNSIFALHFCVLPARLAGVRLVYHEHALVSQRRPSLWHWMFRRLATRADVIVAISEAAAVELRAEGIDPDRIRVVHNALDGPVPATLPARRTRSGGAPFRIAQVANLHRWKGHPTALRAVAEAKAAGLDVQLSLFGRTQDEDYAKSLHSLVDELGVSDRVEFVGYVHDLNERLLDYDTSLLASDAEPFGLVVLEAMRAGIPVVATASGGAVEILRDGESGLLFPPGDVGELVACWRRLIEEPELAERLVRNAHRRLAEGFAPEVQAAGIGDAIRAATGA